MYIQQDQDYLITMISDLKSTIQEIELSDKQTAYQSYTPLISTFTKNTLDSTTLEPGQVLQKHRTSIMTPQRVNSTNNTTPAPIPPREVRTPPISTVTQNNSSLTAANNEEILEQPIIMTPQGTNEPSSPPQITSITENITTPPINKRQYTTKLKPYMNESVIYGISGVILTLSSVAVIINGFTANIPEVVYISVGLTIVSSITILIQSINNFMINTKVEDCKIDASTTINNPHEIATQSM